MNLQIKATSHWILHPICSNSLFVESFDIQICHDDSFFPILDPLPAPILFLRKTGHSQTLKKKGHNNMFMNMISCKKLSISLLLCTFFWYSFAYNFIISNNCPSTIWPGTLAGAGTPPLPTTGFQLDAGQSITIPSVAGWSGRIWARTGCTFDASGVGSCQTGDCGGKLECSGLGATPPASLFEITLGTGDNKDFYDVSIVDGYNLPMVAIPQGVNGRCNATGCLSNLNMGCPKELQLVGGDGAGNVVACKSACEAFGLDQYCCAGQFANPTTCKPSFYSSIFKNACPRAYSYAFDDGTSTFTCKANDYAIIFCPMNGVKRPNEEASTAPATRPIEDNKTGKFAGEASSSNILLPLPMLIVLLISSLYL